MKKYIKPETREVEFSLDITMLADSNIIQKGSSNNFNTGSGDTLDEIDWSN